MQFWRGTARAAAPGAFDGGLQQQPAQPQPQAQAQAAGTAQQHAAATSSSSTASAIAAIRSQQHAARHRTNEQSTHRSPADVPRGSSGSNGTGGTAGRSRVQQPAASAGAVEPGAAAPLSSSQPQPQPQQLAASPLRQHLAGLPTRHRQPVQQAAGSAVLPLFSVFHNPLSSCGGGHAADTAAAPTAACLPGTEDAAAAAAHVQQDAAGDSAAPGGTGDTITSGPQRPGPAETSAAARDKPAACGGAAAAALHKTYRLEVVAAADVDQGLVDYSVLDQHSSSSGAGTLLQDSSAGAPCAAVQQYVYDEDTGQLCRVGQGGDTTRLGRHYLEDAHTGAFYPLAAAGGSGCWQWLRRHPAQSWFAMQQQQQQPQGGGVGDSVVQSLAELTEAMGSGMASLGLFSQGMAGGLALLCLFMSYVQYALAGREGFLAAYSTPAQLLNRAFFSLISVSAVAAASRHAYDSLGHFTPRRLRLGVVDSLVLLLYLLAYTANLLATPLDDQLSFEARRDPGFARTVPLPASIEARLPAWHALNLVRVLACGLAWALVCYRSNPFLMLRVYEARRQQELESDAAAAAGAMGEAPGLLPASAIAGSSLVTDLGGGSGAVMGSAHNFMSQQQQAWSSANPNRRLPLGRSGSGAVQGGPPVAGHGW